MTKIILTTSSPGLDAPVDPRFGRGAYLTMIDVDTLEWQAHPNPGVNASGGAGTQAAQFVVAQKVSAVVSGDFGPNAFEVLDAAGVGMYLYAGARTARAAVEHFKSGRLKPVGAPSDARHHG